MQNRHQLAIEDYLAAEKFTPKDKHVKYNQLIAEGIVAIQQGSFDQALATFDQAQATISVGSPLLKIEPFIYRAMTFIEKVRSAQGRGGQDELETL
jgi:tetratricopeptide (TPR) repeat protein